tara:strand:- start:6942 stop:7583 length:642 start_codon:yes stop_codon:yes gene_type:complete
MDQLELLKQNWKQREQEYPKLSYDQIYDMLFKKSTSIVKWIFIISVLELLFWVGLYFVTPKSSYEVIEKLGMKPFMIAFNVVHYLIVLVFIYYFYKNYVAIKVTENTKTLMERILSTRRTVRYFVIYNVVAFAITLVVINYFYYTKSDVLMQALKESYGMVPTDPQFLTIFLISQIVVGVILVLLLLLFYRLVYGILLRKLKKNYKELERIEM